MNTPIADFVRRYSESGASRLHMPGHKGKTFLGPEKYDITEIDGADVLYSADGIIKESESNAAQLFGSAATFYSTEGSTLCIKAMLSLICKGKKEKPLILAARNVHKAFIYAAVLLDFDIEWMYSAGDDHLCSCVLEAHEVEKYILGCKKKPDAVYITSPDYLGKMWDIKALAELCDRNNIPLVVDNAHGAYLAFTEENSHPIKLGAAMCCDSAHKTLPVLTGGAYLHIGEKGSSFIPLAEECLSLHASTSPSYLIMQSLDLCNRYLSNGYSEKLAVTVSKVTALKEKLRALSFDVKESEPLKLTVSPLSAGLTGRELGSHLLKMGISCEFCDSEFTVMMFTPENSEADFEKILSAFSLITKKEAIKPCRTPYSFRAEGVLTPRQAFFSECELISTEAAEGRICAMPTVSCPPAVPVVVSGELITKKAVELLKAYGTDKISVIK